MNARTKIANFGSPTFLTVRTTDDVALTRDDVPSHFPNGRYVLVEKSAPDCSEVVHDVRSSAEMAPVVTEAIVSLCERRQIELKVALTVP